MKTIRNLLMIMSRLTLYLATKRFIRTMRPFSILFISWEKIASLTCQFICLLRTISLLLRKALTHLLSMIRTTMLYLSLTLSFIILMMVAFLLYLLIYENLASLASIDGECVGMSSQSLGIDVISWYA